MIETPRQQVIGAVAVLALVILGSFAYDQWQRADEALANADRDTRNAAVLLAENTARTFDAVGETLNAVSELHDDVVAGRYSDTALIRDLLQAIRNGVPVLKALGWINPDGSVQAVSSSAATPPIESADLDSVNVLRGDVGLATTVGTPFRLKSSGEWGISVARRLETSDGRFAGIAFAIVNPEYFSAVYRAIELGPSRIAALYRQDGAVLVREPPLDERLGRSVADAKWFREQVPSAPIGTFHGANVFDGSDRTVSYARVENGGEVVSVSILRSDVLSGFYRNLLHGGMRVALTLLALFGGAALLIVQLERRRRADGKFRDLLEAAPDAMVIVDQQGRIALVNTQAESLFGYERSELLGREVEVLMPQQSRERHADHVADYGRNPRIRPMGHALQLEGRRKDGSEFPVEISLSPLRSEDGMLISAAIRDVSRRKAVEAELIEAHRAAEAASAAKSDFLAGMSHELRTPLNAVIGFAQMLELDREQRLSVKQRSYVEYIMTGGRHLLELVSQVLDLAGIEAGRLKLTLEPMSVRKAFAEVCQTMLPLAQKGGITIETHIPEGLPDMEADELRLRQVLLNLVSNAIKYNRPGGRVSLSAFAKAAAVRLSVADTGIGIPLERQAEVFTPFQRLGAERSGVEGTGVGLALSRKLVEAMHGSIGFVSASGSGSSFWIELPLAGDTATVQTGPATASPAVAHRGGYSLLYVEDNPANLRLIEHILSTLPEVAMLSAPTPQLGLDLARTHRPDVIVLDINLPGMSGFELLHRLKSMSETRDVPVLALTAAALPGDVRRGLAAGFFRYLTKPLDVTAFLRAIEEALGTVDPARVAPD